MSSGNPTTVMQVSTVERTDELNARFYGRFPFPWRPAKFDLLSDPDFQTVMLNQNLGDWHGRLIPERPAIWVAGCGTNQALITALTFPKATVLGSDLSAESLELCASTAKELQVTNLHLRRESINRVDYAEQFDYVISTGVIHHNADPTATLSKIVAALKPSGILELMVYNRYERLPTSAFQNALRILSGADSATDFDRDMSRAKSIISDLRLTNFESLASDTVDQYPECLIADLLIQPHENSYTMESFEQMALASGLEILYPACDLFDNVSARSSWNLSFSMPELQQDYYALPDLQRWQMTNCLLFERSPQLWFYLRRKQAGPPRRAEQEICTEFLRQKFVRTGTTQRSYIRTAEGAYKPSLTQLRYPFTEPTGDALAIYDAVDGQKTMSEILNQLGQPTTFAHVNRMRLQLTTTAHPYLRAVHEKHEINETVKRAREDFNLQKLKSIKPKPLSQF